MRTPTEQALEWETALRAQLGQEYFPARAPADDAADLVSRDNTSVIELKSSLQGTRDLHAALTQLAIYVTRHPDVRRATLVAHFPRMSGERVLREWALVKAVMKPAVARRVALVALASDRDALAPSDDLKAQHIAAMARRAFDATTPRRLRKVGPTRWSRKTYEVWKVMLEAWIRREPPLPLHEIERRSGASYPSVSGLLDRLERIGELERSSSRSAILTGVPRRSLAEVLALGDELRETHRFRDASGRASDVRDLVRRIEAKTGATVALGGVEAARHYVPAFDLNGLPRVDVTVLANDDFAWVKKVDPALAETPPTTPGTPTPTLVVHRLRRPEPRFEHALKTRRWFADPAEVLLDLHELRLVDQADDFVRALRGGAR